MPLVAADLASKRFVTLGTAPWMYLNYGIVSLKGRPLTHAATRFREFVLEAEQEVSDEERRLLAELHGPGRQRKTRTGGVR